MMDGQWAMGSAATLLPVELATRSSSRADTGYLYLMSNRCQCLSSPCLLFPTVPVFPFEVHVIPSKMPKKKKECSEFRNSTFILDHAVIVQRKRQHLCPLCFNLYY